MSSQEEDNHRCVVLETVVIWSFINLGFFRHMLLYDHRMRIGGFRHDMRKCGLPFVRLLSVGKMPPLGTHCSKPPFLVQKIDFHKTLDYRFVCAELLVCACRKYVRGLPCRHCGNGRAKTSSRTSVHRCTSS